jgi:hypothetical protein
MSRGEGKPVRRLRALRLPRPVEPFEPFEAVEAVDAVRAPAETAETAESILPGNPRVGALDALLREVDGLRLTLETDLTLAASAVESGATQIAVEILDSDINGLAVFERRALGHLSTLSDAADLAAAVPVARRNRVRVAATPFVAAAAVIGFLLGVVPHAVSTTDVISTSTVAANGSLTQLKQFAADGRTSQVRATARTLHAQLLAVVANAGSDPAAAQQALLLLSYERDAIVQSGDSLALHDVLVQSAALANKIRNAMPATVRNGVPITPAIAPPPSPTASPKPSPTPAKSKPSAKPKPSQSPSPQPSSSPSDPSVLPTDNPVSGG